MITLSQLTLNPANRLVQSELKRPDQLHRTLLQAFGTDRHSSNVLHRIEQDPHLFNPVILVQATAVPNWHNLRDGYLENVATKQVEMALQTDTPYRFRLRACPSKKVRRLDETTGKRYNGKRNSTRYFFYKEKDQCEWLKTRAENSGFTVHRLQISQPIQKSDHQIKTFSVLFEGVLTITNLVDFNTALRKGIGPARAFGCGLLSIAPG